MSSERWKQVEALFEQTLDVPEPERTGFLQKIDDAELRREVESLLQAHAEAGAFLDEPDRFFSGESFETDTLSAGQIIDRYRIIREIGRGGMGAVYLAERADDEYKKQVALKLIKRGTDTDSVLRHFRNERQILAGFDHTILRGSLTAAPPRAVSPISSWNTSRGFPSTSIARLTRSRLSNG